MKGLPGPGRLTRIRLTGCSGRLRVKRRIYLLPRTSNGWENVRMIAAAGTYSLIPAATTAADGAAWKAAAIGLKQKGITSGNPKNNFLSSYSVGFVNNLKIHLIISPTKKNRIAAAKHMPHCCEVSVSVPNIRRKNPSSVANMRINTTHP